VTDVLIPIGILVYEGVSKGNIRNHGGLSTLAMHLGQRLSKRNQLRVDSLFLLFSLNRSPWHEEGRSCVKPSGCPGRVPTFEEPSEVSVVEILEALDGPLSSSNGGVGEHRRDVSANLSFCSESLGTGLSSGAHVLEASL